MKGQYWCWVRSCQSLIGGERLLGNSASLLNGTPFCSSHRNSAASTIHVIKCHTTASPIHGIKSSPVTAILWFWLAKHVYKYPPPYCNRWAISLKLFLWGYLLLQLDALPTPHPASLLGLVLNWPGLKTTGNKRPCRAEHMLTSPGPNCHLHWYSDAWVRHAQRNHLTSVPSLWPSCIIFCFVSIL